MSANISFHTQDNASLAEGNTILGSHASRIQLRQEAVTSQPEHMRGQCMWRGRNRLFTYTVLCLPWSFLYQTIIMLSVINTYCQQLYIINFMENQTTIVMEFTLCVCWLLFTFDVVIQILHQCWPLVRVYVRQYRRNVFVLMFDIVTILPVSGALIQYTSGNMIVVESVRWLETLRIYRIWSYYKIINEMMTRSRWVRYVLEHFLMVVLTLHAATCFWYRFILASDATLKNRKVEYTVRAGIQQLIFNTYGECWYYCACRQFNVIFGDCFPMTTSQKWVTSALMLYGFVFTRYRFIGILAWEAVERSSRRLGFIDRYHHMLSYLRFHEAPATLAEQARQYKLQMWRMKDGVIRSSHLRDLPLALQMELIFDINVGHFHDTLLFRDTGEAFMRHISLLMRHELFLAGQTIWSQGIVKSGMICVKRGVIEMLSDEDDESPMISFKEGTVLGELSLFYSIPAKVTVKAATYVELQILKRTDFMRCMAEQMSVLTKIRRKIVNRLEKVKKRESSIAAYDSKDSRLIRTRYRPMKVLKNKLLGLDDRDSMFEDDSHLYYRDENNVRQAKFTSECLELYKMADNVTTIDTPRICLRSSFPWILEADTGFTHLIDGIHFAVVLYVCVATPYLAVLAVDGSNVANVLNTVVKFVLLLQIYTQLTTAIVIKDVRKETVKEIAATKMASFGFYLDILSLFPIYIFTDTIDPQGETVIGQVTMLCPALQVWHLWDYMRKWNKNFYINAKLFCLLEYSLLFIILCYWSGCFLYLIACPKMSCGYLTWMQQLIFWETKVISTSDAHHEKPALTAIEFGTSIFTGTGSSMLTPGLKDQFVVIFVFILGAYLYSEYCAILCSVYLLRTQRRQKFKESMRELFYFLSVNHVSERIKARVKKFFCVQWYYNKAVHTDEIFRDMSTNIQQDLQSIEMVDTLISCPLFQKCSRDFLQTVASNTRTIVLPDNEVVHHAADIGRDMYVLQMGHCNLINHTGKIVSSVGPGSSFGVIEMLYGLPKVYTVLTTTNCILLHVEYSALMQCLSSFPDISHPINEVLSNAELFEMVLAFEQAKPVTGRLMTKTNRIAQEIKESFVCVDARQRPHYIKAFEKLGVMRWIRYIILPLAITPHGLFLKVWCALRFFVAIYYILTVPYRIATKQQEYLNVLEWCDIFLYVDMLVMAFVAYYNDRNLLITHPLFTITHYLKHAFLLDLICVFPFERLFRVINSNTDIDKFKMNKVLQVARITGAFAYWESDIMSVNQAVVLLKNLPIAVTLVNIMTAILFTNSCTPFLGANGSIRVNCTKELLNDGAHEENSSAIIEYVKKFFWLFNVFLGCACSPTATANTNDTWLVVVLQVVGFLYFCFMHAYVASARSATAGALLKHTDDIRDLANFLYQENVDLALTDKTMKYFEYVWKRTHGSNPQQICKRLNSALMEDTLVFMYEKTLREVPLFGNVERSFIRVITQHLKEMYFSRGETVVQCRDMQQSIYIIYRGKVDVLSTYNEMITCMGPGGMFGNFTGQQVSSSEVTIFASRSLDLLVIPSVTFFNLVKYYPKLQEPLNKAFQMSKNYILPISMEVASDESVDESENDNNSGDSGVTSRSGSSHYDTYSSHLGSRSSHSIISHGKISISSSYNMYNVFRPGASMFQGLGYATCTIATFNFCMVLYVIVTMNDCYLLSWIMAITDIYFYMKIHISMHQGYFTKQGELILDPPRCRRKFFKKKFRVWSDIIANIPLEAFALCFRRPRGIMHYLHANKLLRIKYLLEFYWKTSSELTNNLTILQAAMTLYLVVLMIHTFTCTWLLLMTATNTFFEIRPMKIHLIGHIVGREIWDYSKSFYVMSTTLTGTGGDEYLIKSLVSMTVLAVCLVAGKMLSAIVVATAMQIEYATKHALLYYEKRALKLIDVLKNQGLSAYQLQKLWKYVKQLWVSERGRQLPVLLAQTPYVRRCDLMSAMFGHHLRSCILFSDTGEPFLRQLTAVLEYTVFFPGNYIVVAGDMEARMHWVSSGMVSVVSVRSDLTEITHELLGPGDVFGIMQGLNRGLAHCFSYRAETKVAILSLSLDSWINILPSFPEARRIIADRSELLFAQI